MGIQSVTTIPAAALGQSTTNDSVAASAPSIVVGAGAPIGVLIWGWISFVLGTGATGVRISAHNAGPGFVQVDNAQTLTGLTPGVNYVIPFSFQDLSTSDESGTIYQVALRQQGAPSANGAINGGEFMLEV
jgi:hypothetical protein